LVNEESSEFIDFNAMTARDRHQSTNVRAVEFRSSHFAPVTTLAARSGGDPES
jgi:hypothetical protein